MRERWWPGPLGAAAAALTLALGWFEPIFVEDLGADGVRLAVVMTGVASLLWLRRLAPLVTLGAAIGASMYGSELAQDGLGCTVLASITASANVGHEVRPPRLYIGAVMVGVAMAFAGTVLGQPMGPIDIVALPLFFGGPALAGYLLRERTERATALAERATALESEREVRAKQAVEEERARIARELHDIVSHSISVIVVQTQAVRRRLGDDHPQASDLRAVETVGRQAMAEMRRMLGVLRAQGTELELEPQPGLGQLARLLEQTRSAGLPVDLTVEGEEAPLPPGVDLAAYRIVQEALTNVMKHAESAPAHVRLRYGDRELFVEVEDEGPGAHGNGGGHGLVGMKERIGVYGGQLEYGTVNGRGFRVAARLPVREEALRD